MRACDICGDTRRIGYLQFRYGEAGTQDSIDICSKCLVELDIPRTLKKMRKDANVGVSE